MQSFKFTGAATDRDQVTAWAKDVLADQDALILDTETTSLDGFLVEIAVTDITGTPLLEQLVHPQIAIPRDAARLHGIGDADVADAPKFVDVFDELHRLIAGKRVVIYNAAFDTKILSYEVKRGYIAKGHSVVEAAKRAAAWVQDWARWECAMQGYAAWRGDWSTHHRSYTWPRLNGGHRAAADCREVATILQEMAGNLLARGGAA